MVVLGKGSAKIMPGLRLFRADAACYSATCSILAKKTLRHFKTPEFLVVRQFFFWFSLPGAAGPPKKPATENHRSKVPIGPLEWRWYGLPAGHVSACASQRYLADLGGPAVVNHRSKTSQLLDWTAAFFK